MTSVSRLKAVGAFLALAAIVTAAHVWGDAPKKAEAKKRAAAHTIFADKDDQSLGNDLAQSKFGQNALLTYHGSAGDFFFALQMKPKVEGTVSRPADYLFMVDTSASQAQGHLAGAIAVVEKMASALKGDRINLFTVNIPQATNSLTRGFKDAGSVELGRAITDLKQEVPMGDTDLKGGLAKAIASFEQDANRDRRIVFLGDGLSIHNPLSAEERAQLCDSMVKKGIVFHSVPLGPRLDPANLHGLATGTGGAVVHVLPKDTPAETAEHVKTVVAVPVFYPKSYKLNAEVTEAFPTVLPPLRGDQPTLVVGRMKNELPVTFNVEGTLAGKDQVLTGTENIGDSTPDNFFLVSMFEQWKSHKDQPALNRADRVLAYAYEQNRLTRTTLLAEAELSMRQDRLEAAKGLFEQAKKLDPTDIEADAGLKLVEKLHSGAISLDQLKKQDNNSLVQAEKNANQPPPPPAPATEPQSLLQEQKQRAAVEEQRVSRIVDEAQKQARQLLQTDPDGARELLKRTYAAVRDNPDLSERAHQQLSSRLEISLRSVDVQGARIKRDREEQLRNLADSRKRFDLEQTRVAEEERTEKRLERFAQLMDQARFEDAYRLANAIRVDAINTGRPVPVAATAGYVIAENSVYLTDAQEMRRRREERWLQTMREVEHSHIPFPDEPPVRFPDPKFWREITRIRKERYENSGFTEDDPALLRQLHIMQANLSKVVDLKKGIDPMPLREAVENLQDVFGVTILVDTQAFKTDLSDDDVEGKQVKLPRMTGVSLSTVLRLLTSQVNGTFIVRRDFIEITTGQRAVTDKVIRVYPVADLVIPIPNDFNRRAVSQQLSVLGTAPGLGLNLGSPAALGGIASGVGLGAGLGALGAGLGFGGGFGGAGLGGFGGGGGGQLGLGGGLGIGAGGQVNLGVGGGQLGFGGGQLGQLGNLGGQFGLQGGDQSLLLVSLIRDVVGTPKDWGRVGVFQRAEALGRQGAVNPQQQQGDDEDTDRLPADQINNLGYYPPSRALVVKGSSRFHFTPGGGTVSTRPGGNAMLDRKGGDALAARPADGQKAEGDKVAAVEKPKMKLPPPTKDKNMDPRKIWQEALVKGVNDPGLIIAVADFLAQCQKFDHAAEFLKANLRQGIVVAPWVYDALAIALEASGGSPDEIERARVSAVDLEPQDANGYLRASKTLGSMKQYDRAVAMCRQASLLEPGSSDSYVEALVYSELAQDTEGMQWAAGNLLKQDWPMENKELHAKASSKLKDLARTLEQGQRKGEAERMLSSVAALRQRDLVIELTWQGDADLDLEIREPSGDTCSFLQRQSSGGGTLVGDTLADLGRESYVAASAFPGEYQATIRRIWGRPLGGKATLEIIQHQGTARETRRRETIVFDRQYVVPVTLEEGRRSEVAYVQPQTSIRPKVTAVANNNTAVVNKLRMIADPQFADSDSRMRAGLLTLGVPSKETSGASPRPASLEGGPLMGANRSGPNINNPYLPGGN